MLLEGKKGVIIGVANKHSIAWAVAQVLHKHGAKLAFNYGMERLERGVRKLSDTLEGSVMFPCDVTNDEEIAAFYKSLGENGFEEFDFIIHSVAFSKTDDLNGPFVEASRDGFAMAQDISAYSLLAMTNAAGSMLKDGGSVVCMTYIGAERVIPNYGVMGVAKASLEASTRYLASNMAERQIRVNALSAGPVNTLAARGITDFKKLLDKCKEMSPMKRNITTEEIGNSTLFLVSDLSTAVTGEVLHVDAGFHIS